jgi:ribosomal protein S18 acetylase RimI-like enzyme
MEIKTYSQQDEDKLFDMLRKEGAEWKCYWGEAEIEKYKKALAASITFVAYDKDELCGYVRCRDDDGFGIYIYDLLVAKTSRGKNFGRKLMEKVRSNFPGETVYVMSDVDAYYKKQGYERHGSIFEVK